MALKFDMSKGDWKDAYLAGQSSLAGSPDDQAYLAGKNIGTLLRGGADYYEQHKTQVGKEYQRYLKNLLEDKKTGKTESPLQALTFDQFRTNYKLDKDRK